MSHSGSGRNNRYERQMRWNKKISTVIGDVGEHSSLKCFCGFSVNRIRKVTVATRRNLRGWGRRRWRLCYRFPPPSSGAGTQSHAMPLRRSHLSWQKKNDLPSLLLLLLPQVVRQPGFPLHLAVLHILRLWAQFTEAKSDLNMVSQQSHAMPAIWFHWQNFVMTVFLRRERKEHSSFVFFMANIFYGN